MAMAEDRDISGRPAGAGPVEQPSGDAALELWFAAARAHPPSAEGAFLARIEAEALRLQPQMRPPARPAADESRAARLFAGFGWRGLSGLAASALAGLWIGLSAPGAVAGFMPIESDVQEAVEVVELLPFADELLSVGDEG